MRYPAVRRTSWRRTLLLPALGIALGVAICLLIAGITTAWLLPARDALTNASNPPDPAALTVAVQPLQVGQVVPDGGAPPNQRRPPDVEQPKRPEPMLEGDALDLDVQRVSGRDSRSSDLALPASLPSSLETPAAETSAVESEAPGPQTAPVESEAPARASADAGVPAPAPAPPTPERASWTPGDGARHVAVSAYAAVLEPKGEACGTDVCAVGQICCNASCGTCVPPGGTCSQLSCSMPRYPVSMPCGQNTCSVGQVCCNVSCGICAAPGASCTDQICD